MEACVICDGQLAVLGQLGNLVHFRCVNCGMDQSCNINDIDPNDLPQDSDEPLCSTEAD